MASLNKTKMEDEEIVKSGVDDRKPKKQLPNDPTQWPLEIQTAILTGLLHHKPIGIHAPFRMIALMDFIYSSPSPIVDSSINVQTRKDQQSSILEYGITSDHVWNYMKTLYDLDALNQTEPARLLIPGTKTENGDEISDFDTILDFSLPENEFGHLMQAKIELTARSSSQSHPISVPESPPPPTKQKRTAKGKFASGKMSTEDAESFSSSRSSTPASGGTTTNAGTISSTPATRRSRQRKE